MSDSRYQLLRKIRTLSATVAALMYLFLQANRPIQQPEMLDLYEPPYNIADTTKNETAPPAYNPRGGGEVFLAKSQGGPSF